jgi:hypothetical protein
VKDCKSSEFINRKEERSYEPSKDTDDNSRNPWLGNLWRHLANSEIGQHNAEGSDDSFADHGHNEANKGANAESASVSKHQIESLLSRWAESGRLKSYLNICVLVHEFNVRVNAPNNTSDDTCDTLENNVICIVNLFILVDHVFEQGFDSVQDSNQERAESDRAHVVSNAPAYTLGDADTAGG